MALNINIEELEIFFKEINFTNPRHLKKVLNKYEIIKSFKFSSFISTDFKKLIPEIFNPSDKTGNFFETIFTFFIIILHEFYNDKFIELENYDKKIQNYSQSHYNITLKKDSSQKLKFSIEEINQIKIEFNKKQLFSLINDLKELENIRKCSLTDADKKHLIHLIYQNITKIFSSIAFLTPISNQEFHINKFDQHTIETDYHLHSSQNYPDLNKDIYQKLFNEINNFINQFNTEENKILYLFCRYLLDLLERKEHLIQVDSKDYLVKDLFVMARELL